MLTLATISGFRLTKTRQQEIFWKLRPSMNWWSCSWWIARKKNIETVFVSLASATSSRSKLIWKLTTSTPWAKTALMMRSNSTLRVFLLAVKFVTTTCDWRHCKVLSRFLLRKRNTSWCRSYLQNWLVRSSHKRQCAQNKLLRLMLRRANQSTNFWATITLQRGVSCSLLIHSTVASSTSKKQ